jgi:hypothetical protein
MFKKEQRFHVLMAFWHRENTEKCVCDLYRALEIVVRESVPVAMQDGDNRLHYECLVRAMEHADAAYDALREHKVDLASHYLCRTTSDIIGFIESIKGVELDAYDFIKDHARPLYGDPSATMNGDYIFKNIPVAALTSARQHFAAIEHARGIKLGARH